jgi:16S rRNA (uracil1498-N3)-methyltransferase
LFCHPEAGITLNQALTPGTKAVTFLVGPEGGWAPEEQRLVSEADILAVQFGRRVLRTETAGLALVAACTALMGWQ